MEPYRNELFIWLFIIILVSYFINITESLKSKLILLSMAHLFSAGVCRLCGEIVDIVDILLIVCEITMRFRYVRPNPKVQNLLRS